MGSPDFFLYEKHLSVFLEIPLKDFLEVRGAHSHHHGNRVLFPSLTLMQGGYKLISQLTRM